MTVLDRNRGIGGMTTKNTDIAFNYDDRGSQEVKIAFDKNMAFLQKIKELQEQIDVLKAEAQVAESFNWDKAPVICEINSYRWHLGPEADEELNWADAKAWCQSVGGELPPRDILLQCFMNEDTKPLFKASWYWSSTEFDATYAWGQYFNSGTQYNYNKTLINYVRAVRKYPI